MGRLRRGPLDHATQLESAGWPARLDVNHHVLLAKAAAQDAGDHLFGESVYPPASRLLRAPALYALPVDIAPLGVPGPQFLPQQYRPRAEPVKPAVDASVPTASGDAGQRAKPLPTADRPHAARPNPPSGGGTADAAGVVCEEVNAALDVGNAGPTKRARLDMAGAPGGPISQAPAGPAGGTTDESARPSDSQRGALPPQPQRHDARPPDTLIHGIKLRDAVMNAVRVARSPIVNGELGAVTPTHVYIEVWNTKGCLGERVRLRQPTGRVPAGFTGLAAHNLPGVAGVRFYEEVEFVDSPDRLFTFRLSDPSHCPRFVVGNDSSGKAVLSRSDLFALYELPDGTKWAEHGIFNDRGDLEQLGCELGMAVAMPEDLGEQELLRRRGRYHTHLLNIESQCWIFRDRLPEVLPRGVSSKDAFCWRHEFDPYTLAITSAGKDGSSASQ